MVFSESTDKITITKGVLSGQCKKADNKTSVHSSISLNDYIGNVDGKLTWGGRGFSHTAEDISVAHGILTAKLKNQAGKVVESKLDLNKHIQNTDGVLGVIPAADAKKIDIAKASAPELVRGISTASAFSEASAASAVSASSLFSTSSSTSSSTSVATSVSKSVTRASSGYQSHFSSSHFKSQSKLLLIEETCSKFELKGTFLHAECHRLDGSIAHASIDLNELIGFIDGRLEWDLKGFSKHCFEYALDGFFLVVKYRLHEGEHYHIARLDLRTRLRNSDGIFICVELNKKLSAMLSEVPWMKFKVIAEPDLSVFAKHPVMQETLVRIAETAVEHVTTEMHRKLTIAMEEAITAVTATAMSHVSSQLELLVQDAVSFGGSAHGSITAADSLRLHHGAYGGYANGGAYGHATGNGAGYEYAYGHSNGNGHHAHGTHVSGHVSGHSSGHASGHSSGHVEAHEHHVLRDSHNYAEIAKHAQVTHT
ncbi:hypothetical protein GALMADRAFT_210877 [Galerina marginata CBS 339.88]|uniref:Cyanovirin-N domain-containing protein n=1 Tax=Galerina marginata (strain CBS 339.88) TaxID=685588 RepID=A0A067SZ51_GALM3|nr:hypothetical protein GALMADRAFT_210877 [Galerina marginata CBS 339.88]